MDSGAPVCSSRTLHLGAPSTPGGWRHRVSPKLARIRVVNAGIPDVRTALIRQWELIADAIEAMDLSAATRVAGWTNREVLAHLYVQPHLVERFLGTESADEPALRLSENLSGARSFSELIDNSAREGAALNKVELRGPLEAVRQLVLGAHLDATITTLQGSISVSDYLVHAVRRGRRARVRSRPCDHSGPHCTSHHLPSPSGHTLHLSASTGSGSGCAPHRAVDRSRHGENEGNGPPGRGPTGHGVDRRGVPHFAG